MINTHRPFFEELQDGPQTSVTKKKQKITSTQKAGVAVLQVLSSLAPRHTEVLQLLVGIQQENAANNLTSYSTLKERCMTKMITKSEGNLRSILKELLDHEIIVKEKDDGGNECFYVPSKALNDIANFKRST